MRKESAAAAVIVRRDREDLKTLADLKGRSVSLVRDEVSPGELELKREVVRIGLDPDHFRTGAAGAAITYAGGSDGCPSGRTDAGILRACFSKSSSAQGCEAPMESCGCSMNAKTTACIAGIPRLHILDGCWLPLLHSVRKPRAR